MQLNRIALIIGYLIFLSFNTHSVVGLNIKANISMFNSESVNIKPTINVGFYHIYTNGPYYKSIVRDQIRHLNDSGVLKLLQSVHYVSVGHDSINFSINHEKFVKVESFKYGYEDLTLDILQRYCGKYSKSNVLYFHPKGSFHPSGENENIRNLLEHFAINTKCIEALDRYDTCGARFSIFPTPHYIGNMWWARCSYVNTLVSPLSMGKNITLSKLTQSIFHEKVFDGKAWFAGLERYFSEHWLSTGTSMNPADCLFFDKKWLYGYDAPKDWNVTGEVQCYKALILSDPDFCRQAYQSLPNLYKKAKPAFYVARSRVLNGIEPISLIEWYRNCSLNHIT